MLHIFQQSAHGELRNTSGTKEAFVQGRNPYWLPICLLNLLQSGLDSLIGSDSSRSGLNGRYTAFGIRNQLHTGQPIVRACESIKSSFDTIFCLCSLYSTEIR
ncbi:hypothetical protein D3C72_884330 [compost metagenome]